MNAATTQAAEVQSMTFPVAELGLMKQTIDSLAYSRNKSEQNKSCKLIASFISNMARVRGGKAINNITIAGYTTDYKVKEDELTYTIFFAEVPAKTAVPQ